MGTPATPVKWGEVTLAELLADLKTGFASGERSKNGVIQVRMNNVDTDGNLDLTKATRVPSPNGTAKEFQLEPGDVLFNNTNSTDLVGKTAVFAGHSEPVVFSNHFTRLRTDRNRLDPQYLGRWLSRQQRAGVFEGLCNRWVNQSAVRKEALLGLSIALPCPDDPKRSLAEQKRIAAILDKADAIRRRRQEAARLTDQLIPSLFYEMFGDAVTNPKRWPIVPMGELFSRSPNYGSMLVPSVSPTSKSWLDLRVLNIQAGQLDLSDRRYIELEPDMVERHGVLDGDLLLARAIGSPEHLGKCIIARPSIERWAFDSHLMRVRFNRAKALPDFMHAYLNSAGGRHEFLKHTRRSAVQFNINTKEIACVQVALPPLPQQERFVQAIERVSSDQSRSASIAEAADELFNSLVQRAFRGEL